MVVTSWNHSSDLRVTDFDLEGAFHGTASVRMFGNEQVFTRIRFNQRAVRRQETLRRRLHPTGLLHGSLMNPLRSRTWERPGVVRAAQRERKHALPV